MNIQSFTLGFGVGIGFETLVIVIGILFLTRLKSKKS